MIRDMLNSEKPRERLLKYGSSSLSNEELIAIILKTGYKNKSSIEVARILLNEIEDITKLRYTTLNKLTNINGIGNVKAIELLASLELGKRVYYEKEKSQIILNNTTKVFEYFKDIFIYENQENFYAIYLDSKSKLISYRLLFKGTLNSSVVHPREVFKYAFLESASSIIVMHNHPSGDVTPSIEDKETTRKLIEIGKLVAIPIVDHLIFGKDKYYSFYEYIKSNMNNI